MAYSIELMTGICFLMLGLSLLIRFPDWVDLLVDIQKKGRTASLSYGMLNLLLGSFVVAFHWVWDGIAMLVTIIGLIMLLKGFVYMLFPGYLPAKFAMIIPRYNNLIRVAAVLMAIIGGVLLYDCWAIINV